MELSPAALQALQQPSSVTAVVLPESAGIYAFYLRAGCSIGAITANADGLLYVGRTKTSLLQRDAGTHFKTGRTPSSTLRRSIGAILKAELGLTALPRGAARSKKDSTHYKFTDDGEQRLTAWMMDALLIAAVEIVSDVAAAESAAIQALRPPLNLTSLRPWVNPQARTIKRLRAVCAAEAEAGRLRQGGP